MRALQLIADRKLELADLPAPPPPRDEDVQICIKAVALNHLDLWGFRGMAFARRKLPLVVGAEASGEIAAVGAGAKGFKAGDKVVLWYYSGNRDEDVFDDPHTFNILRNPNPHIAFGGGGPHFCLGAALARTMLKALLTEVYTRIPDISAPEPNYALANFINGINSLPATWTPEKR